MEFKLNSVEDAIKAIADGDMVIVVDDADRENEGDLIMAASKASPDKVGFMVRHTSGILCTPLEPKHAKKLQLDPMVHNNDAPLNTAFTISVDYKRDLKTGISAKERSSTVLALANNNICAADFVRPGHIFPLISREGGVLTRSGHTEAAVDLVRIAGCAPVGLLAEIVNDDGSVKRLKELIEFSKEFNLKIISIADLIAYRQSREQLVELIEKMEVKTSIGIARGFVYKTRFDAAQHIALVFGDTVTDKNHPVLTRIHRERPLDDIFGSQLGREQNLIDAALGVIAREGAGVFLHLRQNAGTLSDDRDEEDQRQTEEWRQSQWKEIGVGAQILRALGISSIRLISGQKRHYIGLKGFGIELVGTEPIDM